MAKMISVARGAMNKANDCLQVEIDAMADACSQMQGVMRLLFDSWKGDAALSAQAEMQEAESCLACTASLLAEHHDAVQASVDYLFEVDQEEVSRFSGVGYGSFDGEHLTGVTPMHAHGEASGSYAPDPSEPVVASPRKRG